MPYASQGRRRDNEIGGSEFTQHGNMEGDLLLGELLLHGITLLLGTVIMPEN